MVPQPVFHDYTRRLKAILAKPEIKFKHQPHAVKAAADDGLSRYDVQEGLKRGATVEAAEMSRGEETWNARFRDHNSRTCIAVLVVNEGWLTIKVITVFVR
jgi:hypothetical protein